MKNTFLFDNWWVMCLLGLASVGASLHRLNFSITAFIADMATSLTVGLSSYYLMLDRDFSEGVSVGVSIVVAHKATRLLFLLDKYMTRQVDKLPDIKP